MASDPVRAMGAMAPDDRFLIEKTEEAIRDGAALEEWRRSAEQQGALVLFPLDLKSKFRLPHTAQGFFGQVSIGGVSRDAMGAVQTTSFGKTAATPDQVREFVFSSFLSTANWTHPNGYPGGFTVTQSLYRDAAGEYGKFTGLDGLGMVDWRRLQRDYQWVLLTVLTHDAALLVGPYRKRLDQAACVSPSARFIHDSETPGYRLDLTVGFPVVSYAPIPNKFGFGPGKSDIAVQSYRWMLRDDGELTVRMTFAAAPRVRKVFDVNRLVPDPVYGGARLLKILTLGLFPERGLHDAVDARLLAQHCRVQQMLLEGVEPVWNEWLSANG